MKVLLFPASWRKEPHNSLIADHLGERSRGAAGLVVTMPEHNQFYLRTKALRFGHLFS